MRTLLLMRHAKSEDSRPGHPDAARRLTSEGERQAVAVGDHLRQLRLGIDAVLCSPATRARQTLEGLGIAVEPSVLPTLLEAGGEEILDLVREVGDSAETVLVVGHAPGIPAAVRLLADPESSEPAALQAIEARFPPAALAVLRVDAPWGELATGELASIHLA